MFDMWLSSNFKGQSETLAHVLNRPPMVMHSQVDIHRYSSQHIMKTSVTEVVSLTVILEVILYHISLLRGHYRF